MVSDTMHTQHNTTGSPLGVVAPWCSGSTWQETAQHSNNNAAANHPTLPGMKPHELTQLGWRQQQITRQSKNPNPETDTLALL